MKMRLGNLINIILNKMLIPELLQSECTPQNINYYMDKILNDSDYRDNILLGTKKAIDSLNTGTNTSELAAKAVMKLYQS
jgi:lipid-A-disaccharide synthase